MQRHNWTREELIIAFNLYCKIPFGRIHIRNPQIVELAKALGRTPSALSWKLANFARLDPALKKRNIAGATHGGRAEVEVWNEFSSDWERLSFQSQQLLEQITGHSLEIVEEPLKFPEGLSREVIARARINQAFFRAAVLAAYDRRCCITGLAIPQLLTASHIVPWSVDTKNRTNPQNGLCLNALHDRAFDCGLVTVTTDLRVKVSRSIKATKDGAARDLLQKFEGAEISRPRHFVPDIEFLRYHNKNVFLDS